MNTLRYRICLALYLALCHCAAARQPGLSDEQLKAITFEQKLGAQVTLGLGFKDEKGGAVRLGACFGEKPVVLVLGYYECPMLCTLVLNGLVESLQDLKWTVGKEFDVIFVSIDPRETPALAAAKKATYLRRYGRSGAAAGWHFLTGDSTSIKRLAGDVGFQFAYDPATRQYAHPSGLVIVTPQGQVSGYLFGVNFNSRHVYQSLQVASSNRVSSPVEKFILLCFHYNPITGKYSGRILFLLRLLSALTLAGLVWLVVGLVRRGRTKQSAALHRPQPEHPETGPPLKS